MERSQLCADREMECEKERGKPVSDRCLAPVSVTAQMKMPFLQIDCIVCHSGQLGYLLTVFLSAKRALLVIYVSLHPTQKQLYAVEWGHILQHMLQRKKHIHVEHLTSISLFSSHPFNDPFFDPFYSCLCGKSISLNVQFHISDVSVKKRYVNMFCEIEFNNWRLT